MMNTIWENSSTAEIPRPSKKELVFGNDVLEIHGIQHVPTMIALTDLFSFIDQSAAMKTDVAGVGMDYAGAAVVKEPQDSGGLQESGSEQQVKIVSPSSPKMISNAVSTAVVETTATANYHHRNGTTKHHRLAAPAIAASIFPFNVSHSSPPFSPLK